MPKPKKPKKLPPMSPVRQDIMDGNGATPEQAAALHRQLCESIDSLRRIYRAHDDETFEWTRNDETDGNFILLRFFESQKEMKERIQRMTRARAKHNDAFQKTFGCPLSRYWCGAILGFDVIRFDVQVVRPTGIKYDGKKSMMDMIREQWGEPAVAMIDELCGGTNV